MALTLVRARVLVALLLAFLGACKARVTEIVVFHADSLSAVLGDAAEAFRKNNPNIRIRLEPSGSQVAARKVSELGMHADIVAVEDAALVEKIMIPVHATWNATFATNEIVLAHRDHSKWTDQITAENWPQILAREGVRLGRADPDTATIGYQTLMVWQLAESSGAYAAAGIGLLAKLSDRCSKEHIVPDEAALIALLGSRAIDYAFVFRSTAEDHHLKILSLPPEVNLSRPDLAARYATAQVEIRMNQGQGNGKLAGAPATYGVTVPANAQHATDAARFVAFLFGPDGRRLFERRGFHPLLPAKCSPCEGLPPQLVFLMAAP